ncbi:MAG: aldo/keto reductase [Anaerolineaceae bacterium]|jgi:voltage-dependent potassium channel beta subunit|nr:aldo/keto reductase [Anaerolineaceae bacterium]
MHYRRLGRTGLKVSEISLGAWITFGDQIERKTAADLVHAAYDQGINFFDNADVYAAGQAEIVMGEAIRKLPRETLVISSKVFWPTMPGPNGRGLSRKHITESIDASLRRLGTDYVDLYYCHRYDPDTPIQEVVWTMNHLIQQGKILYWGTSEWEAAYIAQAIGVANQLNLIPPVVEQPQYNMFRRKRVEVELEPLTREYSLGLTTWSPLASGILTGKYNDGIPKGSRASREDMAWLVDQLNEKRLDAVRQLTALAEGLQITTAQLAIAWLLRRKEISSVITGATSMEQLDENLGAPEALGKMDDTIMEEIEQILENFPE